MDSLEGGHKHSLEVLEVFVEPENVRFLPRLCYGKAFVGEVLLHILVLGVNLERAV